MSALRLAAVSMIALHALAAQAEGNRQEILDSWWQTPAVRACCSEADAVYADQWQIMPDGSVKATVTGQGPRGHAWAPIGREYIVPADKVLREPGNPTGRALLFLHSSSLNLYCFAVGPLT